MPPSIFPCSNQEEKLSRDHHLNPDNLHHSTLKPHDGCNHELPSSSNDKNETQRHHFQKQDEIQRMDITDNFYKLDSNTDGLEQLEQGQITSPPSQVPHHLRPNSMPQILQSSFKNCPKYSCHGDQSLSNDDDELLQEEINEVRRTQSLSVRFIDEVGLDGSLPSVVTETRTLPRIAAEDKTLLFYNRDDMARFRDEYTVWLFFALIKKWIVSWQGSIILLFMVVVAREIFIKTGVL